MDMGGIGIGGCGSCGLDDECIVGVRLISDGFSFSLYS